jgi:dTDP-4-amino-4,6-dideoxygalactose transaminase
VHQFTSFAGRFPADVPRVEALAPRLLTLPLHPLLSPEDVQTVCTALRRSVESAARAVSR